MEGTIAVKPVMAAIWMKRWLYSSMNSGCILNHCNDLVGIDRIELPKSTHKGHGA